MTLAALRRAFALLALLPLAMPAAAAPAAPAKAAVVALALWSDPVFRSEAEGAAKVLSTRYGHGGPVVVQSNTARALVNGPSGIAAALKRAARGVDPARDVLILLLTTHGSPDGMADKGGGRIGLIPPDQLRSILDASPFRHRVVIVSACFAGTYTALASPDTLVMTAADSTHPSFGCQPEAHWTYFGDALFNQALRRDATLPEAFRDARTIVAAREAKDGFDPSNPQMAGGESVLPLLDGAAPR
ncbi:C13 family peptidase [Lichenibacterium dinghuense]|uniref:C13 family peptidase n=1 Tax=Lichenibacterium dinghuense TaxID=2895977 RepID=UPI001F2E202D|nr:C13 family peptidase [Lichenibacterium sp. 6Y81]